VNEALATLEPDAIVHAAEFDPADVARNVSTFIVERARKVLPVGVWQGHIDRLRIDADGLQAFRECL
jgi:hypothetical protein